MATSQVTREEALLKACKTVEGMSTNARGYGDGTNLAAKIDAIERLARFLLGSEERACVCE